MSILIQGTIQMVNLEFKALLDEAGIEYEATTYKVAELSCDN